MNFRNDNIVWPFYVIESEVNNEMYANIIESIKLNLPIGYSIRIWMGMEDGEPFSIYGVIRFPEPRVAEVDVNGTYIDDLLVDRVLTDILSIPTTIAEYEILFDSQRNEYEFKCEEYKNQRVLCYTRIEKSELKEEKEYNVEYMPSSSLTSILDKNTGKYRFTRTVRNGLNREFKDLIDNKSSNDIIHSPIMFYTPYHTICLPDAYPTVPFTLIDTKVMDYMSRTPDALQTKTIQDLPMYQRPVRLGTPAGTEFAEDFHREMALCSLPDMKEPIHDESTMFSMEMLQELSSDDDIPRYYVRTGLFIKSKK